MNKPILLLSGLFFFSLHFTFAATIYSFQNGHWNNNATWVGGVVPGPGDDVVINGESVIIDDSDGDIQVNSITLANSFTLTPTRLTIDGAVTVTTNTFYAYTGLNYQDVELILIGNSKLTVNGDATFQRTGLDNTDGKLQVSIADDATMEVTGDFNFNYEDAGAGENNPEINLADSALLEVTGDMNLIIEDGTDFTINAQDDAKITVGDSLKLEKSGGNNLLLYTDSSANVEVAKSAILTNSGGTGTLSVSANQSNGTIRVIEDLVVTNSLADQITGVEMNNASNLDVNGDIIFSAQSENDVYLTLSDSSFLELAGNFSRPLAFGSLFMSNDARLIYDGAGDQLIAYSDIPGSGADNFVSTNIEFRNTSGAPITLDGDWTVNGNLDLNDGIIKTADTALLIVADGASINGGSATSYIDGPVVKKGTSTNGTFIFPVGHNNVYAPLEVEAVAEPTYEYRVQYFSCPPPIEDGLQPPLGNISGQGFWSLAKSAGAKDVAVTLHWEDAQVAGINDPDSLLVAGLVDNGATKVWTSYGNGGTTGGTGAGIRGTVTNKYSDPPPLDEVTYLTLGSTNKASNALPVILLGFKAESLKEAIRLDWTTIMEEDVDYFLIERSINGKSFMAVGQVTALGTVNGPQSYDFVDEQPLAGENYYRLKQVDYNGNYMYSPIISAVLNKHEGMLKVFPNLVQDEMRLSGFEQSTGQVQIEIIHQSGQQVYKNMHVVENQTIQLSTRQMNIYQTGMYHVIIREGAILKSTRIIVIE